MAAGLDGEALLAAVERIEAASVPLRSARQERNARYYARVGLIPADVRLLVIERDGRVCAYCGDQEGPFELDHVMPGSRGGPSTPENLTVACKSCNASKRDRTPEEWACR